MFEELEKILSGIDADFADIRYERVSDSPIQFIGNELTEVSANKTDGYVLRVLKNGGFSSVTFSSPADAPRAAKKAQANAMLLGEKRDKPIRMASSEKVVDTVIPELKGDPREVTIDEKITILRGYNQTALNTKNIISTIARYDEVIRDKFYMNTEGSRIQEQLVTPSMRLQATAKDGTIVQPASLAYSGRFGFDELRYLHKRVEDRLKLAIDLLSAEPVKGGSYNCVLNYGLTGVFTHEAFGHFSEADIIENLPEMRRKMALGAELGSDILNIIDDATAADQIGTYTYDDEGVPVRKVYLIKDGVLSGRLHSRRTSMEFGEPLTGHCVAADYNYDPIIRMGNIFIEPRDKSFEELLAELDDGLYLCDPQGGETHGENFSFGAVYGFIVKNGKKQQMIRDINISGNLYQTLKNIQSIGNDFRLRDAGGCGKGQINIRSSNGGPSILVKDLVIGGR